MERLGEVAREEGRPFQEILEDAKRLYLESRDSMTPPTSVMANVRASVERNRQLGKLFSK